MTIQERYKSKLEKIEKQKAKMDKMKSVWAQGKLYMGYMSREDEYPRQERELAYLEKELSEIASKLKIQSEKEASYLGMKLLDKWMTDFEEAVYRDLLDTRELVFDISEALKQRSITLTHEQVQELIPSYKYNYGELHLTAKYEVETYVKEKYNYETHNYVKTEKKDIVEFFTIRGIEVKHSAVAYPCRYNIVEGILKALRKSTSDYNWLSSIDRSDADIRTKAHKEMLEHRYYIEQKVLQICGKEIVAVEDEKYYTILVKGSNGRTAKLWTIVAGGYNIQCEHTRVLVKEVK